MKKFIFKILLYLLLFFAIIIIGIKLPINDKQNILFALEDKKIIADSISKHNEDTSVIWFVGGSNVIFSINTKRISDSLKIAAYNLAIHAGFGMKFDLENAFSFAKENDIIILSPEYENFWEFNLSSANGQLELLYTLLEIYPNGWKIINNKQRWAIIKYLPRYLHDKYLGFFNNKKRKTNSIYTRSGFNQYGDLVSHEGIEGNKVIPVPKIPYTIDMSSLEYLDYFNKKCIDKKIRFMVLPPSYQVSSYINNKEIREQLYQKIQHKNIKILGTPKMFCYPDNAFLDTYYHTLVPAREQRTDSIIQLLKFNNYSN